MASTKTASRSARLMLPNIQQYDWQSLADDIAQYGCAVLPNLLETEATDRLAELYAEPEYFRKRIIMARHGFGRGEYQYFANPLPTAVNELRQTLYPPLAHIANGWRDALRVKTSYPAKLDAWLRRCHKAGQNRPTPLLLKYGPGDFNALHQDVYGDLVFPLQVAVLLSEPGRDFTGGEFVMTEQRPRMQSRAEVVPLSQGDAVVFPVHSRPVEGTRGTYRVTMRHGVSRVRTGERFTLGLIFHDAL